MNQLPDTSLALGKHPRIVRVFQPGNFVERLHEGYPLQLLEGDVVVISERQVAW